MFTWICPQCGREVPPSYTECPDCAAKAAGASGSPGDQPPASPPPPPPAYPAPPPGPPAASPQYYPYPQQYPYPPPYPPPGYPPPGAPSQQYPYPPPPYQPYQQPVYGQPPYAPPPPSAPTSLGTPQPDSATAYFPPLTTAPPSPSGRENYASAPSASTHESAHAESPREPARGSALFGAPAPPPARKAAMPTWLLTILCTAGFALVVVGAYWIFGSHKSAPVPSATVESPAAKPGAPVSPWQKFIEVSGVRLMEDPKHKGQVVARFLVTNHSESDIQNLAGNVTIWAGTKRSDEDAQGTFSFKTAIGPYDSKELTEPFSTKLKVYELPDWNVSSADLQITSPAGPG